METSAQYAASRPQPLFIYGTLCAMPLLSWVLTGDVSTDGTERASRLVRKARVNGYSRVSVHHCDYPAAVEQDGSSIDGYLLTPETSSQRRKLDDFEGEAYKVTSVTATISGENGDGGEAVVADMYVWNGEREALTSEPWNLETFIESRLDDWLDLFEGMELVGEDEED